MARKHNYWMYAAVALLVIGLGIGLAVPIDWMRDRVTSWLPETPAEDQPQQDDTADTSHDNVVMVSEPAFDSLGIKVGLVKKRDYRSFFEIPAQVREMPGVSQLHVASRFEGLVKKVFVTEGQSVRPGQPICEIELTSESLAMSQADFLDAWQKIQILDSEIQRVAPLVADGVMPRRDLLDLQYEQKRLKVKSNAKMQELLIRGLTEPQIADIKTTQKLVRRMTIEVPDDLIPPQRGLLDRGDATFIAARLVAKPGAMLESGGHVLELAYHQQLVVVGHAFEKDLPRIRDAIDGNLPVTVTIGSDENEFELPNQQIAFLSNHADNTTNTFPFFVYIENEMLGRDTGASPDKFINWRWKPGQRAHVELTDQSFKDKIVLPRQAVAIDGIRYLAFRRLEHEHEHDPNEEPHEHFVEFEAVDLVVVYTDRKVVVVEPGGNLKVGEPIAFTQATQLLYGLNSGNGGGGHAHPHPH